MKKIIISVLVLCLALLPVFVVAQPRYEADFSFSVAINGAEVQKMTDYIYIYNSDVIDVSLNLKTNEDFYAGPLSTEISFSDSLLKYNSSSWNKNGKLYSASKSYSNITLQQEDSLLKLDMIPSSADCKVAPDALNEKLLTIQLKANGKRDDIAGVYIDESSVRSRNNPFGSTYFACYTEEGDFNGKRYDFGSEIDLDFSLAKVEFVITDAGDINCDNRITASDSLAVIQHTTGILNLEAEQRIRADVNGNGKVNSSDALAILQISSGINSINDIMNL